MKLLQQRRSMVTPKSSCIESPGNQLFEVGSNGVFDRSHTSSELHIVKEATQNAPKMPNFKSKSLNILWGDPIPSGKRDTPSPHPNHSWLAANRPCRF